MMHSVLFIFVIVLTVVYVASTKNILFLAAFPSLSHHIWNREITNGLSANGHNVTVLSADVDAVPPTNVHYLLLNDIYVYKKSHIKFFDTAKNTNPFKEVMVNRGRTNTYCAILLQTNGFAQLLAYPDDFHFDLVLYDFTVGPCLLPFLHKFNYPPLVAVSAYNIPSYTSEIIGGHQYYAYVPHNSLPNIGRVMNIFDRALNMLIYTWENLYRRHIIMPSLHRMHLEKFGALTPLATDLERRAIVALVNMDPVLDPAQPLPPNVITVAGLHIKEANLLPADIESFINESHKGAVLISLGTNIRSELMPIEKRNIIIQALREMPDYYFVWKFESDFPELELPKNVLIRRWLPQIDILAHANVKAFFTHSGQLSMLEAIWRGVPLLCMPFAYDQHQNAAKAKQRGIAEIVDFFKLSTNEIKSKLSKLLEDPKYADASKRLSQSFRDQKETPLARALWHIEWSMRNPHPEHLKSPTLNLGHVAANNYDVIVLFIVATALVVAATWKLFKFIASMMTRKPEILNRNQKKTK